MGGQYGESNGVVKCLYNPRMTRRTTPATVIDGALELAVLPSFSRVGPRMRSRLFGWEMPEPNALAGRTALVTGPTSGIGRQAARDLARAGARVVLVGRDADRLGVVADELSTLTGDNRFPLVVADMSSLASVDEAVARVVTSEERVDVLVDNAGAMYPERTETSDGIEKTLAVLVCGPFALVRGLMPLLMTSHARVIAVTSGGMYTQRVHMDDLEFEARRFDGAIAYAQAKRIQVALIREWARRFSRTDVSFNAMHPGWADTPGLARSLPTFQRLMKPLLRSPHEGADTILWLATSPELHAPGGRLYLDRRPRPFDRAPQTRLTAADRAELWEMISERTSAY
jgi:dehydrogenase/reductase SDR family protein 12